MDVVLNCELEEKYIMDKMNENTPRGIKILEVVNIARGEGKKPAQAMASIDAAKYIIKLRCTKEEDVKEALKNLMDKSEWNIIKTSKKTGEKMVDIKALVYKFEYEVEQSVLIIKTLVACGSRSNLSAQLLVSYIKENISYINQEAFVDIEREEMYGLKDDKLVTLSEFFKK